MTSPREKFERRKETFEDYAETGEIDPDTAEAIRELLNAYDGDYIMQSTPEGERTREPSTLMAWLYRLMQFAKEKNLTQLSADEVNQEVQRMHDGSHPTVKDSGIKKSTLRSYQAALRKLYGYHDFGVEPSDIPMYDQESSPVNPEDMLTKEEIQEAREAARNPRDKLIFQLLLYTGQRREALRTLKIKHVKPQEETYRLNPEVDGLKGAQERNGNRPLLGAKAAVQNWLEYHPDPSNPEHYLITARPSYSAVDPSEPVSGETIRRVMQDIKADTDIQKPMHPHAMRHNFVTIAKRDYGIPDDTIKYFIGHDKASQVMETTYSHLSGEDHTKRAEEAFGIREPEEDSPLTPDVCDVCGNSLDPNAKACPRCGNVFTPDAKAVKDKVEQDTYEAKGEVEDGEEEDALDEMKRLLRENPELIEELQDQ